MRSLTESELRVVLEKLTSFIGSSVKEILLPFDTSSKSDRNVFRLSHSRVYLVPLSLANLATSIPRRNLLSCGTCLGMSSLIVKFHDLLSYFPCPVLDRSSYEVG